MADDDDSGAWAPSFDWTTDDGSGGDTNGSGAEIVSMAPNMMAPAATPSAQAPTSSYAPSPAPPMPSAYAPSQAPQGGGVVIQGPWASPAQQLPAASASPAQWGQQPKASPAPQYSPAQASPAPGQISASKAYPTMAPGIMAMQPGVQSYVQAPISSGHPQMGPGRFQVPMTPGSYVPMTTVSAGQHGGRQRSFGATEPGSHMLGIALGAVAIGAVVGWKYAGPLGGLAGGLLGGAAVNGFRAAKSITHGTPDSDKEAAVSGTYAVAGAGAAIYLLYRATNTKASAFLKNGSDEPEEEDDEEDVEPNTEETADEADEDSDA